MISLDLTRVHLFRDGIILKPNHMTSTESITALPFLSNSEVFLFPIVAVLVVYVFNFVGYPFGLGFNASRIIAYVSIARHVFCFSNWKKYLIHVITLISHSRIFVLLHTDLF